MDPLYEQHIRPIEPKLIRAAWRLLGNEHDVDDALQEALSRIWKHRWQLESHANPSAWMLRIVQNVSYDRLRLRKARHTEILPNEICSSSPSPSSEAEQNEWKSTLLEEIGRLSPKQSQAVLLRLVENEPYSVVAAALGCSEATARVHIQRGREQLRKRLTNLKSSQQRSQK